VWLQRFGYDGELSSSSNSGCLQVRDKTHTHTQRGIERKR